jgi:hypothetical protein
LSGKNVMDLHMTVCHSNMVKQQFHKLSLLIKTCLFQYRSNFSAKYLNRVGHLQYGDSLRGRYQLLERALLKGFILIDLLEPGKFNDLDEVGHPQTLQDSVPIDGKPWSRPANKPELLAAIDNPMSSLYCVVNEQEYTQIPPGRFIG